MSDLRYYFDKIADEFNGYYAGKRPSLVQEIGYRIFRGPGLKRRFRHTLDIVGDCEGAKVLDVGCGPGVYTQYFAKKGAKVTAIDVSRNMIELTRQNLMGVGIKEVNLIHGDFLEFNFTNTFDYILAIGFFDYVPGPKRDIYFDKLRRTTEKKFIATFPRLFTFQAPIRQTLFFIKRQPVFFYTKKMIIDLAKRHDLEARFYNSGPIWTVEFIKI